CRPDKADDLVRFLLKNEVSKPALHLRPFVTLTRREAYRVLVEGLVKDGNTDERRSGVRRSEFGKCLEHLKVAPVWALGGILQHLPGFIEDKKQAGTERGCDGGKRTLETA